MIIDGPDSVTKAVLSEIEHAPDPRFREVMSALVRHLHAFIREVKLSEVEFQQAAAYVNAIGQNSNAFHNEAVLMSGSLGVSTLVCLLNNGNNGQTETTANLLGPFWRLNSPRTENGGSIVRSPTPGPELFVTAHVKDPHGKPVASAEVDIWQSSTEGLYENQDPTQADMNLRGKFTTDAQGEFLVPKHPAGWISDPDQRAGRRSAARAGPPQHAAGAPALSDLQGRAKDAHLTGVCAARTRTSKPTCSSASPRRCSVTTFAMRPARRQRRV